MMLTVYMHKTRKSSSDAAVCLLYVNTRFEHEFPEDIEIKTVGDYVYFAHIDVGEYLASSW